MNLPNLSQCKLCELHKSRTRVLLGEGDPHADIMLIAQAPGELEDRENQMFIGPSGQMLDRLFADCGLIREDIYLTNLLKCRLPQNRRPKQREIAACSIYLEAEIRDVQPRIVSPLGYFATKYSFETRGLKPFTKADYPTLIGKAFPAGEHIIYPLSHPTSLIHHPEYYPANVAYYKRLLHWKECKWYRVCPLKRFTEELTLDPRWVNQYCLGDWQSCERYRQEEAGIAHPDNLLPDGSQLKLN